MLRGDVRAAVADQRGVIYSPLHTVRINYLQIRLRVHMAWWLTLRPVPDAEMILICFEQYEMLQI